MIRFSSGYKHWSPALGVKRLFQILKYNNISLEYDNIMLAMTNSTVFWQISSKKGTRYQLFNADTEEMRSLKFLCETHFWIWAKQAKQRHQLLPWVNNGLFDQNQTDFIPK